MFFFAPLRRCFRRFQWLMGLFVTLGDSKLRWWFINIAVTFCTSNQFLLGWMTYFTFLFDDFTNTVSQICCKWCHAWAWRPQLLWQRINGSIAFAHLCNKCVQCFSNVAFTRKIQRYVFKSTLYNWFIANFVIFGVLSVIGTLATLPPRSTTSLQLIFLWVISLFPVWGITCLLSSWTCWSSWMGGNPVSLWCPLLVHRSSLWQYWYIIIIFTNHCLELLDREGVQGSFWVCHWCSTFRTWVRKSLHSLYRQH